MKKSFVLGLAFGLTLTAASAMAADWNFNNGSSGIAGSSHDLSAGNYALTANPLPGQRDYQSRICVYCHHPHHSERADELNSNYSPLWNRAGVNTGSWTAYNNSANPAGWMMGEATDIRHMMNGTPAIGSVSLLCLSCHDGSVALNAYSSLNTTNRVDGTGSSTTGLISAGNAIAGKAKFGEGANDMSNHHPIGMVWADVAAADGGGDDEIAPMATEIARSANTDTDKGAVTIEDVLYQGKMECVTCHDVHNSSNEVGAERFLWRSNNRSNFCLTCHLK